MYVCVCVYIYMNGYVGFCVCLWMAIRIKRIFSFSIFGWCQSVWKIFRCLGGLHAKIDKAQRLWEPSWRSKIEKKDQSTLVSKLVWELTVKIVVSQERDSGREGSRGVKFAITGLVRSQRPDVKQSGWWLVMSQHFCKVLEIAINTQSTKMPQTLLSYSFAVSSSLFLSFLSFLLLFAFFLLLFLFNMWMPTQPGVRFNNTVLTRQSTTEDDQWLILGLQVISY